MPTLLGLCGLPAAETAEGIDYAPLLRQEPDAPRREDLVMQLRDWACIRHGSAKLTLGMDGTEPRELYRLDSDPFEEENLVNHQDERSTVKRLQQAYSAWLEHTWSPVNEHFH